MYAFQLSFVFFDILIYDYKRQQKIIFILYTCLDCNLYGLTNEKRKLKLSQIKSYNFSMISSYNNKNAIVCSKETRYISL